jgi:hypothetical protein
VRDVSLHAQYRGIKTDLREIGWGGGGVAGSGYGPLADFCECGDEHAVKPCRPAHRAPTHPGSGPSGHTVAQFGRPSASRARSSTPRLRRSGDLRWLVGTCAVPLLTCCTKVGNCDWLSFNKFSRNVSPG